MQIQMNFNEDTQLNHISFYVRGKEIIQNKYSTMTNSIYLEFFKFHTGLSRLQNFYYF